MDRLVMEKVSQAIDLMGAHDLDCWVIFTHETGREADQTYPILMGALDLGGGILLLTRGGRRVAIVSGLDRSLPASTGAWDEVVVYTREKSALENLVEILRAENPRTIGANFSETNPLADGLGHGKYIVLKRALNAAGLGERLVGAEAVASALRQVKTGAEIGRIRAAIAAANGVFRDFRSRLEPGMSGIELFRLIGELRAARGATNGWSAYNDPILTVGPVSYMGHTPPPEGLTFDRGMLLQVDLGLRLDGYCSDFQRMFYATRPMETHAPAEIERLFGGVYEGISRMIAAIGPGIPNDGATKHAFEAITDLGFPEPQYGGGHQLGRAVHDGGVGLLSYHAPMPGEIMKRGNVFTVEGLETRLAPYGWVSLEEDVVVTESGCEVLTERQTEIWCV